MKKWRVLASSAVLTAAVLFVCLVPVPVSRIRGRALVQAVESLLDGRPFFTSTVAKMVLEGYLRAEGGAPVDSSGTLSPRERHIVQLLAEGKSNKDVARALDISVNTVETHRANIMRKMGFASLADLVRYAVRNKIIEP